jgi:hypothetical protein
VRGEPGNEQSRELLAERALQTHERRRSYVIPARQSAALREDQVGPSPPVHRRMRILHTPVGIDHVTRASDP